MAINQQGQKILAQHANKFDKYQCPHCKSEVILKQGMTLIAHFAHKTRLITTVQSQNQLNIMKQSYI